MDKKEFESYCKMIEDMMTSFPLWYKMPRSIISDFLYNTSNQYGFGKVLYDLAQEAYEIINEDKTIEKDSLDLCELAVKLNIKHKFDNYNFIAYLFVIDVLAVCLKRKDIDDIDCECFDSNDLIMFDSSISISDEKDPIRKKLKHFRLRLLDVSRNN